MTDERADTDEEPVSAALVAVWLLVLIAAIVIAGLVVIYLRAD